MIFFFSSQKAEESRKTSAGFITAVVEFFDFDNSLTDAEIQSIRENITFIVRKGAHFSLYAVLGLLIYMLLCEYAFKDWSAILLSVVLSMLYACSDEFHQSFVAGRSGELRDVLIDTVGAFAGCIVVCFLKKLFRRKI